MNLVTRQRGAAPEPARPAKPDKPRQPPAPGRGSRMLKGVLRVVVPIGAMVVTYYVTNKVAGSALAAQFQGMPPQMIPMLISMAVGGITRQITK
jgi:predicted phage tail protein